jgi:hypothetical protein
MTDINKQNCAAKTICRKNNPSVTINVCNKKFITKYQTLETHGNNRFIDDIMNNNYDNYINNNITLYYDRNPDTFKYILSYLRNYDEYLPPDLYGLKNLKQDSEYFNMTSLSNIITKQLNDYNDLGIGDFYRTCVNIDNENEDNEDNIDNEDNNNEDNNNNDNLVRSFNDSREIWENKNMTEVSSSNDILDYNTLGNCRQLDDNINLSNNKESSLNENNGVNMSEENKFNNNNLNIKNNEEFQKMFKMFSKNIRVPNSLNNESNKNDISNQIGNSLQFNDNSSLNNLLNNLGNDPTELLNNINKLTEQLKDSLPNLE